MSDTDILREELEYKKKRNKEAEDEASAGYLIVFLALVVLVISLTAVSANLYGGWYATAVFFISGSLAGVFFGLLVSIGAWFMVVR